MYTGYTADLYGYICYGLTLMLLSKKLNNDVTINSPMHLIMLMSDPEGNS